MPINSKSQNDLAEMASPPTATTNGNSKTAEPRLFITVTAAESASRSRRIISVSNA